MQWNKSWQSEQVGTCCVMERLCCSLEENLQAERILESCIQENRGAVGSLKTLHVEVELDVHNSVI